MALQWDALDSSIAGDLQMIEINAELDFGVTFISVCLSLFAYDD